MIRVSFLFQPLVLSDIVPKSFKTSNLSSFLSILSSYKFFNLHAALPDVKSVPLFSKK
jgi:hypothetical protein